MFFRKHQLLLTTTKPVENLLRDARRRPMNIEIVGLNKRVTMTEGSALEALGTSNASCTGDVECVVASREVKALGRIHQLAGDLEDGWIGRGGGSWVRRVEAWVERCWIERRGALSILVVGGRCIGVSASALSGTVIGSRLRHIGSVNSEVKRLFWFVAEIV